MKDLLMGLLWMWAWFVGDCVGRVAIVGGAIAAANDFSYQATLLHQGEDVCGAGIIGDEFVVTAAHCVLYETGQFIEDRNFVLVGTTDTHKTGQPAAIIEIIKIYVPKEYIPTDIDSPADIAVLKLRHSLKHHLHLKPLDLPKHKDESYVGKTAKIAGFGWDWIKLRNGKERGGNHDSFLRYADVDIISPSNKYYNFDAVDAYHICARIHHQENSEPRGVCIGDSGGPLVHDNTIIGILSISPEGCSEKDTAAVYTRVSKYLAFIHDAMHGKFEGTQRHL